MQGVGCHLIVGVTKESHSRAKHVITRTLDYACHLYILAMECLSRDMHVLVSIIALLFKYDNCHGHLRDSIVLKPKTSYVNMRSVSVRHELIQVEEKKKKNLINLLKNSCVDLVKPNIIFFKTMVLWFFKKIRLTWILF